MLCLKRKIKEEENSNSHICSRFWSTATQLLCHLAGGGGGKRGNPWQKGQDSQQAPDVGSLSTESSHHSSGSVTSSIMQAATYGCALCVGRRGTCEKGKAGEAAGSKAGTI